MSQTSRRDADVVIVGAGLSGMIAARTVLAAGLQPLVLEADERVGGRILTEEVIPGLPVELGAQWIGDTHHRMFALAEELGVQTYPQYDDGQTSYELVGSGVLERTSSTPASPTNWRPWSGYSGRWTNWRPRFRRRRPGWRRTPRNGMS